VSTVAFIKGYRLYFVSFDGSEPIHVHVRKENRSAKVWVETLALGVERLRAAREQ